MLTMPALHAYTSLTALARSWPALRTQAGQIRVAASDGLRSPLYGQIRGGGHGDGGILRAVESGADEWQRWQDLLARVAGQVTAAYWIARSAALGTRGGPLATIARALPACTPSAARDIAQYLGDADRAARRACDMPDGFETLVGVPCPICDTRLLQIATSARSRAAWTVTCGAKCHCLGSRCGCAATGAVPAVDTVHIWRWTVIAARLVVPNLQVAA